MDLSFRFDLWHSRLPKSPVGTGRVEGCVLRTGPGERATPQAIELTPAAGIQGDSWKTHPHSDPENQVALINVHVLQSVAGDDPQRRALSGDNLHVDLDLSEQHLPVGSLLDIGTAQLRVTPLPHRPCSKFVERFGQTAAKKIARANRRGLRARGVLCKIVRAGRIQPGDQIRVTQPSAASTARPRI